MTRPKDARVGDLPEDAVAAIVDLDGTLYDGYIWQALTRHHLRNRFNRLMLGLYLGVHFTLFPLFQLGWISPDYFYRVWGENMAWLVRGVTLDRAREIWNWLVNEEICPQLRPEVTQAMEDHKARGHHIILLSGTFQPLLETLAQKLGADAAVATPLGVTGRRYTGKIIHPLNIGDGKLDRLRAYCAGVGSGIDLGQSFFYTDSIVDLPVMEVVGFPVAVYPDAALDSLARARSWPVIGSQKTTP